jgi:hypothetical protein
MHWQRGTVIPIRYIFREKVRYAEPGIVVEDTSERLIVLMPEGTITQRTEIDFASGTMGEPEPKVWHSTHNLRIFEPGNGTCISAMYRAADGQFLCWYIDFIEPFHRSANGIETWDLSLDIVADRGLRWSMKDEDHFRRIQELGWITFEHAEKMLQDKEKIIARIERRDAPFDEDWHNWRPDPSWHLPVLPDDWARVPA